MPENAYIAIDLKSFYASVAEPLSASALRGSHPLRGSAWSGDLTRSPRTSLWQTRAAQLRPSTLYKRLTRE